MPVFTAAIADPDAMRPEQADQVKARLMQGDICVLPDIFSPDFCAGLIAEVIAWAEQGESHQGDTAGQVPSGNWFRRDINPEKSAVKRVLQTHDFGDIPALPDPLRSRLETLFPRMAKLQAQLSGVPAIVGEPHDGARLHPQIIHYPSGGGYFGRHTHPLEPQRVGLIVSLSERHSAFETGSTLYYGEAGEEIDLDAWQTAGSVTAFRYDIPHAVTVVDAGKPLSFGAATGRWVAIMPLH